MPALANLYAYGANAGVNYFRADGSLGSETTPNNNDILGQFTWRGWNGAGAYTGSQALVDVLASGNWVNGSNYGAHLRFATTAQGSTAIAVAMSIWGGVVIGSGTTDPGAGNIAFGSAFGIYSGSTLVADYNTTNSGAWTFAAGIDLSSGGLLVGAATGGNLGTGKINVAGGIYLNNSAYTNPDYVFERHFTGKIERFADRPRAMRYAGRLPLDELERHVAVHLRFPGISEEPTDIFERGDIALEKLEEQALYLFELSARVGRLEHAVTGRR